MSDDKPKHMIRCTDRHIRQWMKVLPQKDKMNVAEALRTGGTVTIELDDTTDFNGLTKKDPS